MALVSKRRKDTWTVGHEGGNNIDHKNPYNLAKKDSTKSVLPGDNNNAKYVFH